MAEETREEREGKGRGEDGGKAFRWRKAIDLFLARARAHTRFPTSSLKLGHFQVRTRNPTVSFLAS